MKKSCLGRVAVLLCAGSTVIQGCPAGSLLSGMFSSCFGEDTISAAEFDDLNLIEQLLYEENDCGRFEPRSL